LGSALITGLCLSLGACSQGANSDVEANDLAIRACTVQTVQSREGFNPQTASVSELSQLADTAKRRSDLASQAAALSERWLLLSEVSAAIAAFAQQLIEAREEGAISLSMWDDYKTVSNTYLAECQSALKNVSGPLLEMDDAVTALMSLKDS
jgi:hypothetical protein